MITFLLYLLVYYAGYVPANAAFPFFVLTAIADLVVIAYLIALIGLTIVIARHDILGGVANIPTKVRISFAA
jgi:hypothetical protein